MSTITETMNEQFQQLVDFQTKSLEPLRTFAAVATDAAEQVARQNYAVAGDVLDYAAKQANLPLNHEKMADVASAQLAEANTFAELMSNRATEYADMAQVFNGKVKDAADSVAASFKQ